MNFSHIFASGDSVLIAAFCALLIMSIATWFLIIQKGILAFIQRRSREQFVDAFWCATDATVAGNVARAANNPLARIAVQAFDASQRHRAASNGNFGDACSLDEFLVRTIRNAITQEAARLEWGLSVLGSIASTAPFVGLFGTVWGIYHSLVDIASKGQATLDVVAGPIGEALIATAGGLAAAIPAVLAYNTFVRRNRLLLATIDGFAHDLHARLVLGGAR